MIEIEEKNIDKWNLLESLNYKENNNLDLFFIIRTLLFFINIFSFLFLFLVGALEKKSDAKKHITPTCLKLLATLIYSVPLSITIILLFTIIKAKSEIKNEKFLLITCIISISFMFIYIVQNSILVILEHFGYDHISHNLFLKTIEKTSYTITCYMFYLFSNIFFPMLLVILPRSAKKGPFYGKALLCILLVINAFPNFMFSIFLTQTNILRYKKK